MFIVPARTNVINHVSVLEGGKNKPSSLINPHETYDLLALVRVKRLHSQRAGSHYSA